MVKQKSLIENDVTVEEVPADERAAIEEALELSGGDDNKAFKRKRQEIVKFYKGDELKLLQKVGVLDILKGHVDGFKLVQAVRSHALAEALIPAVLYSMETPQVFRLARQGPGGQWLTYVPGDYTKMMLNTWFPGWCLENVRYDKAELNDTLLEIICHGELVVTYPNGIKQRITATGRNPVNYIYKRKKNEQGKWEIVKDKEGKPIKEGYVSLGNAYKGAETDCIKKAAASLGIGWDVYYGLYSPQAMAARKEAVDRQREQESAGPPKGKPGAKKIEEGLRKSFKLSKTEPLKSFWAKVEGLYGKGKVEDGEVNAEIHEVATEWLRHKKRYEGKGLVSFKGIEATDLQEALIGIALNKLHPKLFPGAK